MLLRELNQLRTQSSIRKSHIDLIAAAVCDAPDKPVEPIRSVRCSSVASVVELPQGEGATSSILGKLGTKEAITL